MRLDPSLILLVVLALTGCAATQEQPRDPPDPELVTLEGALTNRFVKAAEPGAVRARIRIGTEELTRHERAPANLVLVIDTSGSMRGQPIEDARDAALELLDALHDDDILSVVAFHSRGEVLVPATRLSSDARKQVRKQIGKLESRGTTDLYTGLALGLQEATRHPQDGINRMVLLSDGIPNVAQPITSLADAARRHGVSITALGLGLEYDETLLAEVARRAGGQFHYVEQSEQVAAVFRDEVLKLQRAVASGLALRLLPGPGVSIERVTGQQVERDGRALIVHLGDLSEGQQRDLVVELSVAGRKDGAVVELLDAQLRFQDMVVGAGVLGRELFLAADATAEAARLEEGRDPEVERSAERAEAAAAIVRVVAMARSGDLAGAEAELDAAEQQARRAAERFDDAELREQADAMKDLREALPSLISQAEREALEGMREDGRPPLAVPEEAPATVRRVHADAVECLQGE